MATSNPYALPAAATAKPAATTSYTPPDYWSIFTGKSDAPGNPIGDKNYWNTMGGRIGNALWPGLASQLQFANTLVPQQQNALSSMLTALNPSNLGGLIQNFNAASNQAAGPAANAAGMNLQRQGLSSGAVQGAQQDVYNQTAAGQNANMANLLSPQGIQNAYATYLQGLGGAMTPGYLPMMQSLMGGTPPTVSSGNGWSNLLGGVSSLVPSISGLFSSGAGDMSWVPGALAAFGGG